MKRAFLPLLALALTCAAATIRAQSPAPAAEPVKDVRVVIHTDRGDIEATIFASKAPITSANFLNLASQHFYDGTKFHRIIAGFMTQGGDPTGTGMGGPGYQFEDEKNDDRKFDKAGILAMANKGTNTNGSQFFITHGPTPHLNDAPGGGHYTIFGQVTKGQSVVTSLAQGEGIKGIDILDPTGPIFAAQAKNIDDWNKEIKTAKH